MDGHAKLAGRGAVVTGAGHGIGRALATKLVAEGSRVVVNDIDAEATSQVAEEIGAIPVPGDCSSVEGVHALISAAQTALGRIDVFCANAGIDRTAEVSLETSEIEWSRMHEVNVMGHVRAARLLIPDWVGDGRGGRFVVTNSAAGLLTMIGSAPYAVTKHASLAFAEWLAVTYGNHGVTVQAICPQSVQTRMLDEGGPVKDLLPAEDTLSPEAVADAWVASLDESPFLVLPHHQVAKYYTHRASDPDRWLTGMRRLQDDVDARSR